MVVTEIMREGKAARHIDWVLALHSSCLQK